MNSGKMAGMFGGRATSPMPGLVAGGPAQVTGNGDSAAPMPMQKPAGFAQGAAGLAQVPAALTQGGGRLGKLAAMMGGSGRQMPQPGMPWARPPAMPAVQAPAMAAVTAPAAPIAPTGQAYTADDVPTGWVIPKGYKA